MRLHLTALEKNRLDGFGNAVPANSFRTETGHQADDQGPGDRNQDRPIAQLVPCGRNQVRTPALEVEQIGEKTDQSQQCESDVGTEEADGNRQRRYPEKAWRRGEVS